MTATWTLDDVCETDLPTLAGLVAFILRPGDLIALAGNLGAGKTTLARALVRSLLADPAAEVPSPTFSLVQTYDTPRFPVAHADLYRLAAAADISELGLDETLRGGVALVEWPERAEEQLPRDRLTIALAESGNGDTRRVMLTGSGDWPPRLARLQAMYRLVVDAGWLGARVHYFQGDASPRRYARLLGGGRTCILMDAPRQPDGPPIRDGLPYSRIAHLAEDVKPFVAVTGALKRAGLSAPELLAHDMEQGLLLVEDLGDRVYGAELKAGASQAELWRVATEALLAIRRVSMPDEMAMPGGATYRVPAYDRRAMAIETELLIDWYWPAATGLSCPPEARGAFAAAWRPLFDRLLALPRGWVLRDYHSPNLIWLPQRDGAARVGIIDVQDAVAGHAAYDLVSLLQDARLDVPAGLEAELLTFYCRQAAASEPGFSEADFRFAYAVLGAQRNTKILGIFARLARRDRKPQYLAHLPRIWGYVERNLASPELAALKAWYDVHLPSELRGRDLSVR